MAQETRIRPIVSEIVRRLVAEYRPQQVVLFGSYARGEPHPDSDLDLLIIKETSDRFLARLWKARRIAAGSHQEVPLELLVLTPAEVDERLAAGDQFIAGILAEGQVLYAA